MSSDVMAAVVRYEVAAARVSRLSKEIGEAIAKCSISIELEQSQDEETHRRLVDGIRTRTHLYNAFHETTPCDSGWGSRRLDSDEIEEYLREEANCSSCLAAYQLIEQRRAARKEFGIAKRAIRTIGRTALARMSRLFDRRTPKANGGFSWGRFPAEETIQYRLFRRDHTGALHLSVITFAKNIPTEQIAADVRRARHQLRNKVDEIDLAAMGVTE